MCNIFVKFRIVKQLLIEELHVRNSIKIFNVIFNSNFLILVLSLARDAGGNFGRRVVKEGVDC